MKRPYLNEQTRKYIRLGLVIGEFALYNLACEKFKREFRRSNGWIKRVINYLNERL